MLQRTHLKLSAALATSAILVLVGQAQAKTTYNDDAMPVFAATCSPCHAGAATGGHNIAISYADSQKAATVCADKTIGECGLERMIAGTMPPGGGASADAIATIQAWVDDGMAEADECAVEGDCGDGLICTDGECVDAPVAGGTDGTDGTTDGATDTGADGGTTGTDGGTGGTTGTGATAGGSSNSDSGCAGGPAGSGTALLGLMALLMVATTRRRLSI